MISRHGSSSHVQHMCQLRIGCYIPRKGICIFLVFQLEQQAVQKQTVNDGEPAEEMGVRQEKM